MVATVCHSTFKSGGSLLSVWGAIFYDSERPMIVMPEKARRNSEVCRDLILNGKGCGFYHNLCEKEELALWQHDGAPAHT
jgi:hypothetical protein